MKETMKRDFLKQLGIEDENIINKIIDENSSDIGKAKGELENITKERDTLKATLDERDGQLEELKKTSGTNEELKAQIEKLQSDNHEIKINAAVEKALLEAKAKNTKAVKALLQLDGVEFEADGSIKGLSEQIKSIQKDNDYMFNIEDSKGTGLKGAKPGEAGGEGTPSKKPEDMTYEDFCNQEG